ncbi:uncharacterized protein LOC120695016 [Panicum virgatum]|uniref:uncharacterized protein LOC120695016 n=1 Tax=Panicum virgatum TaxID=38727 RepID=UPI0019D67FBF|nr:uncharacterized protein LOC120695016 [Panicum virgatum]
MEIHGDPLHRTALPPTLQGFFHGRGEAYDDDVPRQEFGQFASLLGRAPAAAPVIDPSFPFITRVLPWTDHIFLLDSRNGLLLFGHLSPDADDTPPELDYIVCNPATEQWVAVPGCGCVDDDLSLIMLTTHVSLLFDPARSSHFHLVLFWDDLDIDGTTLTTVHTYSSEAGVWSHSEEDWSEEERQGPLEEWRRRDMLTDSSSLCGSSRAMVDGLLYLILGRDQIIQVDVQGKTRRIIPAPLARVDSETYVVFVGQSQGLLHCIVEEGHEGAPSPLASDDPRMRWGYGLSVWVLQGSDSDMQQWTFKHRMTNQQLFGRISCRCMLDYHVVTMHPDCNLIFFVQHRDARLISYDIDRQEVRALHSFQHDFGPITLFNRLTLTPYVPYLSELFLGVIGAHKQ